MRKWVICTAACVVILLGGSIFGVNKINTLGNNIEFTETTVAGDISAAKGIEVDIKAVQQGHVQYDSAISYIDNGKIEGKSTWKYDKKNILPKVYLANRASLDIESDSLGASEEYIYSDDIKYIQAEDALEEKIIAIFNKSEKADSVKEVVKPSDYIDYYPIGFNYNYENMSKAKKSFGVLENSFDEDISGKSVTTANKAFREFFKIPILKDEKIEVKVSKGEDNSKIFSTSSCGKDHFGFYSACTFSGDTFYLWFNNETDNGKNVDTSQIPGGYGIYSVPMREDNLFVDTNKIKCVYSLDPEAMIIDVNVSVDKKHLYVSYFLDDMNVLDNVEISSGKCVQKIKNLGASYDENNEPEWYSGCSMNDQNTVLFQFSNMIYCYKVDSNGMLKEVIKADCSKITTGKGNNFFNISNSDLEYSYDGKRLAIVSQESFKYVNSESGEVSDAVESCDINLAVFDRTGLKYYGIVKSALTDSNRYGENIYDFYSLDNYSGGKCSYLHKLEVKI